MSQSPSNKRGGHREGSGRKPAGDQKKKRHSLTLDIGTVDEARKHTDNLSGLVEELLKEWLAKKPVDSMHTLRYG